MYVIIAFNEPPNIETQEAIQRQLQRKIVKIDTVTKKKNQQYLHK